MLMCVCVCVRVCVWGGCVCGWCSGLKNCDPLFGAETLPHPPSIPYNPPSSAPLCATLSSPSPPSPLFVIDWVVGYPSNPPTHTKTHTHTYRLSHTLPWLTDQSTQWSPCRSLHQTAPQPPALDLPRDQGLFEAMCMCECFICACWMLP